MEWAGVSSIGWFTFFHILLFVFWLGADLGVFYAGKYVARSDYTKAERLQFLELLLKVDMYPRTSLILMLPVGFTLTHLAGWAQISAPLLGVLWVVGVAWLWLMWSVHHKPQALGLKKLDLTVRWVVIAGLLGLAGVSLFGGVWTDQAWLSLKLILFAATMGLGLALRGSIALWIQGFGKLESDPDAGNALIKKGHKEATRFAHTLWACLIVMAFLGVAKPLI